MASEISYLQSLPSVRETCEQVFALAEGGGLDYWTLDPSKQPEIVDFCCSLISRDFGVEYDTIPPHGRWRHFLVNGTDRLSPLIERWSADLPRVEVARRLVDLFVVSVLMDAGAGDVWRYREESTGQEIGRSEGLAVGTLHAFTAGLFSSSSSTAAAGDRERVDAGGLSRLGEGEVAGAMQSRAGNEMAGLAGRARVLRELGRVLGSGSRFFPAEKGVPARPGNVVDYLLSDPRATPLPRPVMRGEVSVPLEALWEAVVRGDGLAGVWPEEGRIKVGGRVVGDVWRCEALARQMADEGYVTFHKLSQWLTYSLIEVLENTMGWHIMGKEAMTGLPEYRNGGLLIDFGYLVPKPAAFRASVGSAADFSLSSLPPLAASHPAMIEMRAVTVSALDRLRLSINSKLGSDLSLPQVLESATWKGGREVARRKRPTTGGPPVNVLSDGTVF